MTYCRFLESTSPSNEAVASVHDGDAEASFLPTTNPGAQHSEENKQHDATEDEIGNYRRVCIHILIPSYLGAFFATGKWDSDRSLYDWKKKIVDSDLAGAFAVAVAGLIERARSKSLRRGKRYRFKYRSC